MNERLVHRRRSATPLPIRDGLNPTRVRVTEELGAVTAHDFVTHLIATQRHRHPEDDAVAVDRRFRAGEVVDRHGTPLPPAALVSPGTDVWFYRTPAPETPVPYDIEVVHEDERLLVVDKPPFLATMPRGQHITETATVRLRRATGSTGSPPESCCSPRSRRLGGRTRRCSPAARSARPMRPWPPSMQPWPGPLR